MDVSLMMLLSHLTASSSSFTHVRRQLCDSGPLVSMIAAVMTVPSGVDLHE